MPSPRFQTPGSRASSLAAQGLVLALLALSACDDTEGDPCSGIECSGHGRCVAEGSAPRCECDEDFRPNGTECMPDVPDGDGDSDIDGDSDTDVDGDTDVDSDTDTDVDGDSDIDGDGDTDDDEDGDTDADIDVNMDRDSDVDAGCNVTANFEVCTGRPENCPGNPPFPYEIAGGGIEGRYSFDADPPTALTLFNLRDEVQSLSVTGYDLLFEPDGDNFVTAEGGERARFSIIIGDLTFSTSNITESPEYDSCAIRIRYLEDVAGFDLEFSCNHIDVTRTRETLTTLSDGAIGPGNLHMDGCLAE